MSVKSRENNLNPLNAPLSELTGEKVHKEISVLLLNNSDSELEFLKNRIEKYGQIKVIGMARNSHEARNIIKQFKPDLIIMDILHSQCGGIGFLKRLHHFYPRPVLLICTKRKIPYHLALSAFKTGVYDIIDKDKLIQFDHIPSSHDFLISKIMTACC